MQTLVLCGFQRFFRNLVERVAIGLNIGNTEPIGITKQKEQPMNTKKITPNNKKEIIKEIINQMKVCEGNLKMLSYFAPTSAIYTREIKRMLELIKSYEAIQK